LKSKLSNRLAVLEKWERFRCPVGNTDGLARAIPLRRLGKPDDYPRMNAFLLNDDVGSSPVKPLVLRVD
jgi:NAD(P)-dependent dehydrogenase (short-subunit alcohol dehydrogenase family)